MIIVILIFVILSWLIINATIQWKMRNYPPGPFPWPFIGNQSYLRRLTRELGGQHNAFLKICKRYNSGIITLRLGVNNVVVVSDSKLIQETLGKEEFDGRPWNEFAKMRNFGLRKGITMNDGADWKDLRAWSIRTLRDVGFAKEKMVMLLKDELAVILEKLRISDIVHVRTAVAPAVINVLWTMITGQACNDTRLNYFLDLLKRRKQAFDMTGGILSSFPWLRYIAPSASGYKILDTLNNELRKFLMDTINEHKQHYAEGSEVDFIDFFLREMFLQERESSVFADDHLLVMLIDFFLAGINTTTATLDFLFLQITNHQDIQRRLHEEIDAVIGSDIFPDLRYRPSMPFTEAVLTECQRIWHVIPIIGPRRVLRNTTLGGYTIPKDTTVLLNIFSNNMNPELYPDPTLFKPERFLKNGAYQPDKNIILFGKGRRRCPGEALAKSALFLLFVGVMKNFHLYPLPGEKSIKAEINFGLTIEPKFYRTLVVPR